MEYLKKHWLIISIIILLLICIIMILIYFKNVSNNFSTTSDDWGNFGGYLGSITGVLAFAGVLYSIQQSNKTHTEDSERDIFFQLLELHTNKVNAVEFNGKRGAEAFKELLEKANKGLMLQYIYQYIIEKCSELSEDDLKNSYKYNRNQFSVLELAYQTFFVDNLHITAIEHNLYITYQQYRNLIEYIKKKELKLYAIDHCENIEDVMVYLKDYINKCSSEVRLKHIQEVEQFIYKEYGHILGHYFRNMYYVMDTIDKFSDKKNYRELFRAQLSRYELALGLFNAVSSNSSDRMIHLLKEFKVFKDTYPNDITVLKVLMDKEYSNGVTNQDKMLAITNSILDNWKA